METERLSPPDPLLPDVRYVGVSKEIWAYYLALRQQGYTDQQLQTLALLELAWTQAIRS